VEVAQRHFEVEEINKVMKQLHLVVASVDDSRVRERAHAIETRLRKTLGHMAHGKLSLAWKGWSSFLLRQRRKKNLLSKAASKMLHRTMVDCFKSWMNATVQCNAERKLLLDEEQVRNGC
jgi:arginine decarboxylase-like protein